ncbi:hypothetical protein ACYOEI_01495 [Singulisphaera rosea]
MAEVRNYSAVPPISKPRGFPEDANILVRVEYDEGLGYHPASWLSVSELLESDYDAPMEDRRIMRDGYGGCTCEPGEGQAMSFREFLGQAFFDDLAAQELTMFFAKSRDL